MSEVDGKATGWRAVHQGGVCRRLNRKWSRSGRRRKAPAKKKAAV